MPNVDMGTIEDAAEFGVVPNGKYLCEVIECVASETAKGNEMWNITMKIVGGKFNNRRIWDRVVFAEGKAMSRMKLVTTRLGIAKDFKGNLRPDMLMGRRANVTVETEEYDGKERNKVTFDGYEKIEGNGAAEKPSDDYDSIPF